MKILDQAVKAEDIEIKPEGYLLRVLLCIYLLHNVSYSR